MTRYTALRLATAGFAVAALPAVAPGAAVTAVPQLMPAPTPNADALAATMRVLGSNPRNVSALLDASELSVRLADIDAAQAFIARAQTVDATNPRIQAARASVLVAMERPGEALRLYDTAERAGVSMTPYLAQRALAYDLTGQPALAQRDYRRALADAPDDETTRRLALSLGVSGQRQEAQALLDPLLRRNDRASWRAWAFVLALAGDQAEAQKIATGMMAAGSAMTPFFARLPALSPADRAFAVHFGRLTSTPARVADAGMAPGAPNTSAPVRMAAREPAETPRRASPPVPPPQAPAPVQFAARSPVVQAVPTPTPAPVQQAPAPTAPAEGATRVAATIPGAPVIVATTPTPAPAAPVAVASAETSVSAVQPAPITRAASTLVAPPASLAASAPTRTPEVARRNTQMLASIIEGIAVPAAELEVAPPPRRAAPEAAPAKPARETPTPAETRAARAKAVADAKAEAAKLAETKKAADAKKVADTRKAADAKKLADAKKAEAKKPDPAKEEPQRWWVQVAGGANQSDLSKDWKRVSAKSAAALRGKEAYTTPLRATNRLLTGPFKTQAEAMALVNRLSKEGTSAFAWQSPAGQKISRLAPK